MHKTIGVLDLEHRLRAVLEEVVQQRVPYVLTEDSRPEAVLVPYDEFLRMQKFQEAPILARFDELLERMAERNAKYTEDEVAQDVAAARAELSH
ncbi:MAG TPA: type II toxin-antitoxin system prevent-host-death family antitoxin [Thermoanaerobaculia bacterium]|nr:type II toxin-antitoxin system prevent-host-death family antitoxin [Thermoanaerobaculia bacterium]